LRIGGEVAFEEPSAEVQTEQTSPPLSLGEGDELILFGLAKHAVQGGGGGRQPLAA
jgi:hypothetical protein